MENMLERLNQQRREVEKAVEETVRRTLARLRVPRREELAEISARLETIASRIERLEADERSRVE